MGRLLRLQPFQAGIIVGSLVLIGVTLQGLTSSQAVWVSANVILVLVVVGWPTLLVNSLSSQAGDRSHPSLVRTAFAGTLIFHGVIVPVLMLANPSAAALDTLAVLLGIPLGLFAPLYVFWAAARLLEELEGGATVAWERCVGTFLLLLFLLRIQPSSAATPA
jgi:hypothetical protein